MKFATITLSTLFAVLTVESAAVKAESISQPQIIETTVLAQQHRGTRRGGHFSRGRLHHHRFRGFPDHRFRHRTLHHFPRQVWHRTLHPHCRFQTRLRYYPCSHRLFPRYYPFSRRRVFFPSRRTYVAPEHLGPEDNFDNQGLAKRVILGMVADSNLKPLLATLDVRQEGNQILLSGEVPTQDVLDSVVELAKTTKGAKTVDSSEVIVLSE